MLIWEYMVRRNYEDLQMLVDLKNFNEFKKFYYIDVFGCQGS